METIKHNQIRAISICIFINQGKILVVKHHDKTNDSFYFRPPGGGIKFQESSEEALVREMKEELGVTILKPKLIGVLEDVYYQFSKVSHQIAFVYLAKPPIKLIKMDVIKFEDGGNLFEAYWIPLADFNNNNRLTPAGLGNLLNSTSTPIITFNRFVKKKI